MKNGGQLKSGDTVPQYLVSGNLSSKNRKIFDALWVAYNGNLNEVLQHVQVEEDRYRRGIASIEPQMSVDARVQQVTADRSVASLLRPYSMLIYSTGGALMTRTEVFWNITIY